VKARGRSDGRGRSPVDRRGRWPNWLKFVWKSLLKWAECDCSPGRVASLSTIRPLDPNRSVNNVARLPTGAVRLYGSWASALDVIAARIRHTRHASFHRDSRWLSTNFADDPCGPLRISVIVCWRFHSFAAARRQQSYRCASNAPTPPGLVGPIARMVILTCWDDTARNPSSILPLFQRRQIRFDRAKQRTSFVSIARA